MDEQPDSDTTIGAHYPAFLLSLDESPKLALREFYEFLHKAFQRYPPKAFRMVREDDRADVIHDIVVHCCENDFRVLRTYRDLGVPFGVWLNVIATRRIIGQLRKRRGVDKTADRIEIDDWFEEMYAGGALSPDRDVARRVLLHVTMNAIGELGERCQMLLLAAAEGFKPHEMLDFLGDTDLTNKQVSDALRECRRQLRRRIKKVGIDPESVSVFWRPNRGY